LETADTARERGVKPLFEVCGFGNANDAREIIGYRADAEGATAAIEQALEDTGINASDIACIISGANGSRTGDAMEARAFGNIFNGRLNSIPASAPNEVMGGSGAFCAVTAGLALGRGEVPPTAGFTGTDLNLKLSAQAQPFHGEYALVTAFSCDGNNTALVIRSWKD
jgi:3-oxoacyl-(acyl-carrier-protein) synthase